MLELIILHRAITLLLTLHIQLITYIFDKAHGRIEFWEETMYKDENTQASCQHCHQDIDHLKGAEALKEGDEILKKGVCFGCHRIDEYENIVKISPPLGRIGEKVSYTWLVKWLMDPSKIMDGATSRLPLQPHSERKK
jgi:mono/diheme cytochrome c family protein